MFTRRRHYRRKWANTNNIKRRFSTYSLTHIHGDSNGNSSTDGYIYGNIAAIAYSDRHNRRSSIAAYGYINTDSGSAYSNIDANASSSHVNCYASAAYSHAIAYQNASARAADGHAGSAHTYSAGDSHPGSTYGHATTYFYTYASPM